MRALSVATVVLFVATTSGAETTPVSPGRYAAVTESEWSVDLDLQSDSSATLEIASREPGEADHPKVVRYKGTWRASTSSVTVEFNKGEVIFRFNPQLSFAEFGKNGSSPGLVGASATFEPGLILVGRSLWLKSELRKIAW